MHIPGITSVLCLLAITASAPNPQLIGINPSPPTQGGSLTITYTPVPANGNSVTLSLDWNPDAQPDSVTIDLTQQPCEVTITVPGNATSLHITDDSGNSADLTTPVTSDSPIGIAEPVGLDVVRPGVATR